MGERRAFSKSLFSNDNNVLIRPRGYKTFFMLISTEHENYPALKNVKMPSMVGISTFISRINILAKSMTARQPLVVFFYHLALISS